MRNLRKASSSSGCARTGAPSAPNNTAGSRSRTPAPKCRCIRSPRGRISSEWSRHWSATTVDADAVALRPSDHVMPAIDVNDLTGDEGTGAAREKHAGGGEFIDRAEPAERDFSQDLVARL